MASWNTNNKETHTHLFYGWYVLIITWICYLLCTTPYSYGVSVLMPQMVKDGAIAELTIGRASSARYAATAVFSTLVGLLIRRIGLRFTIAAGALIIGVSQLCIGVFHIGDLSFILLSGVIGAGLITAGVVSGPSVVNAWFEQKKSLAMAILLSAGSIGGIIMPLIADTISLRFGWRVCWILFAFFAAVSLILVLLVVRERPEDIGETKDGATPEKKQLQKDSPGSGGAPLKEAERFPWKKALRNRCMYIMSFLSFSNRALFAAFTSFIILYALANGLSSTQAALALSVYNIANFCARILAGFNSFIPLPKHITNALSYLPLAAGAILLFHPGTVIYYYIGSALFGLGIGYTFVLYPLLVPDYFGNLHFASLYGIFNTIAGFGSTLTPVLMQLIAYRLGGYQSVFLICCVWSLLCGISSLLIPPSRSPLL